MQHGDKKALDLFNMCDETEHGEEARTRELLLAVKKHFFDSGNYDGNPDVLLVKDMVNEYLGKSA